MLYRTMKLKFLYFLNLFLLTLFSVQNISAQTYQDVRQILINKCASCHKSTDSEAPFSLETYQDVKKRTRMIKEVIQSNYMPPWMPDSHYQDFANNRQLSGEEKDKIIKWIDKGAPQGNKKQQNTLSKTTSPIDRKPDLTLKINKPFIVKGNNKERFVLFKVPFELLEDKNIEGVEFYSDNKKVVHHVNYMFSSVPDMSVDLYQGDPYIDNAEETDMKKLMQYEPFQNIPVFYTGWIPGASVEYYPKDFGWTLPKRGVVIFTVHYSATAADEQSTIGVNLYFKKTPAKRPVRIISLGSGGIGEKDIYPRFVIPPDQESTFSLKIRTPEDQSLLYVWPHMHYLGKDFKAFAVTLHNDTIPLIHIPKWNFEWQEMYRMKKLVKVPAGSTINIVGTFDNTANNPQNPNSPSKYVYSTGNMTSTDEMLTFLLIYAPYQSGDEEILLE